MPQRLSYHCCRLLEIYLPCPYCRLPLAMLQPAHLSFTSTGELFPPTHRSWELSRLSLLCFLLLPCLSPLLLLGASASSPVRLLRAWPFSEGVSSSRARLRSCSLSRLLSACGVQRRPPQA